MRNESKPSLKGRFRLMFVLTFSLDCYGRLARKADVVWSKVQRWL